MPNGLIFYRSGSFFFLLFSTPFSVVTERISTKLGHIFTYDCYLKNLVRTPRALTHTGWGQNRFFGTDFELWPNISLQRNMISTIRQKVVNLQGIPNMPPNLVNFVPETTKNGRRVFAHHLPLNFWIGRYCQPYRMDVIQQRAGKLLAHV